jgi:CRISPR-associated protein Cmx8
MPDTVTLTYDPLLLPTAQHRAGLAGLLVLRESLHRRGLSPLPEWEPLPDGRLNIGLTREALQLLVDDLYDGVWDDRESDSPPKSKTARNIQSVQVEITTDGKTRQKTRHRYQDYAIKAGFYEPFSMPPLWRKLWRDAIWATLRGKPTTRGVYRDRADGKPAPVADALWRALAPARVKAGKGSTPLTSSIFVGAQDRTAEDVPFVGRPDETLLLHFWPIVSLIGEARRVTYDRKKGGEHEESLGYVFAVPDVADLAGFVQDFPDLIAELTSDAHGYRPRDGVLSLPHEGALEYLRHVAHLARSRAEVGNLAFTVTGVEIFQLQQRGNNIDLRATARVPADPALVESYEAIQGQYRNPLFRAQLIRNLLDGSPWYHGFDRLFAVQDRALFVGPAAGPFAASARRRFVPDRPFAALTPNDQEEPLA